MQIQAKQRLIATELTAGEQLQSKLNPAELRNKFVEGFVSNGAAVKGTSAAQHQGKMTVNGEPATFAMFEGNAIMSGVGLRALVLKVAKQMGFKVVDKIASSNLVIYQDEVGNCFWLSKRGGSDSVSFKKKSYTK